MLNPHISSWIAPEMLLPSTKISCAVDIFSYGCIMYYVLSEGQHPFGNDVYRRQNNILNYDYDLSSLSEATQGKTWLCENGCCGCLIPSHHTFENRVDYVIVEIIVRSNL